MKGEIRPAGYLELIRIYMDRLTTKKLIALFNDFKAANDDVIMELCGEFREQADAIKMVVDHFSEMCDMKAWFEDLGKRKG
jgi:hypothetical protein